MGVWVAGRIGGIKAGDVGEQQQQIGIDEVGDLCRKMIIVADVVRVDLLDGDDVVLVDDRDDAEFDEPDQRVAGVEIADAVSEVRAGEQGLSGHDVVLFEQAVPQRHEATLSDGGEGLPRLDVPGMRITDGVAGVDAMAAGDDRTRGDEQHLDAARAHRGDLIDQIGHGRGVQVLAAGGQHVCANFHNDAWIFDVLGLWTTGHCYDP